MIYIDHIGHLVSDVSEEELHKFAHSIGLKREWYQRKRLPHYDCTTDNMRQKAMVHGAKYVSPKQIVIILRELLTPKDLDTQGVRIYKCEEALT